VRAVSLGEHTFFREIGILQRTAKAKLPIVSQLGHYLRDAAQNASSASGI
jgi:hypothetical protein